MELEKFVRKLKSLYPKFNFRVIETNDRGIRYDNLRIEKDGKSVTLQIERYHSNICYVTCTNKRLLDSWGLNFFVVKANRARYECSTITIRDGIWGLNPQKLDSSHWTVQAIFLQR